MKYNPSINIEYGIDKDFHYIVTPNAQAVTGELVSNFHSGIHSFSIIGTYGTGKSSYLMALERDLMEGSNYLIQNSTVFGENFGGFECLNIKVYSIYPVAADSITALHNEELIQGKQLKPNSVQWVRPEKMKYVVGVQGCAWTEFMNDEKQLEYMIFPRLLAVAEMAWTQEKKRDWQDFKPRMNAHIPQLQARGINTFTLTDEIELTTRLLKPGKMEVVLDTEKYPVEIRYTLDGTNPTMSSLKYEKPFVIHDSVVVKAAIFREERMVEPILVQKVGVIEEITNYFEYIEPEHWKELNL